MRSVNSSIAGTVNNLQFEFMMGSSEADIWSFVFEKRGEKSFPAFSLHSERLASLKSHCVFSLPLSLLLPLFLSLLHLLDDHQPHVLLKQQRDSQLSLLESCRL